MTAAVGDVTPRPIVWRRAEVVEVIQETSRVKTLVLDVPGWPGHRAGEHVDVRLTAPDGYQAERSYSIASPPEGWRGFTRRVDRAMIEAVSWPLAQKPHIFICGPTPLVESAANACVELGHDPVMVKTERFGATGGR